MPILKKLARRGNARAIVLERPLLEALGITDDTTVALSVEHDAIVIRPVREVSEVDRRFEAALLEVNERYGPVFARLAQS